jgi:hypothetical protein
VIVIVANFDAFRVALQQLEASLSLRVKQGLELTLESIAARAKQTTTFTDRTGNLRNSIQSDGVIEEGGELTGVVSFAATSEAKLRKKRGNKRRSMGVGYPYGLAQEFGTRTGVREKRFIRDAIDDEDGDIIESAMARAFRDAGFEVRGA